MNLITQIAREIRTKFLPINYTPSEPNVQGHIEGIDAAIGTLDSNLDAKMDKDTIGTTGNLTVLDVSKNAVDAGYAASQSPTASSVVQRQSTGQIKNDISSADNTDAIRGSSVVGRGIYGTSNNVAGVEGYSASGSGIVAASQAGTYAIEAKSGATQVSGIRRVDGVLEFVGVNAVANRAAQRTELGLGTAALAATGDFDAAGAAAAAQAASLQKSANLSDVASVTAARANLDIPITPPMAIRVIGDSIPASTPVSDLQAAINNVTVSTFAIGGETSAGILSRVAAVSVVRPARTATLSGATDLVIAENVPSRLVDGGYSTSWQDYSNNQMLQIDNVAVYNHKQWLGGAARRKFFARCTYGTSSTDLELFTKIPGKTVTPESTFEHYANGSTITAATQPSFFSISRFDATISTDFSHTGLQSGKFVVNAAGGVRFSLKNGTQDQFLNVASIYEVDIWIYIPVAFQDATDLFQPSTIQVVGWLDGTGPVNTMTDIGVWKRMHYLMKPVSGTPYATIGFATVGDVGKAIYIDDLQIFEQYAASGVAPIANDTVFLRQITGSTSAMPAGLSEYRRYYLSAPTTTTTKLSLTSGGAAVDLATSGFAEMWENFHLSWTPSAPDTTTHYLTARAESHDYNAFALIWSGHNDTTGPDVMIANIERTVDEWRNKHSERFAVLTLVNRFGYGTTFYHDDWEYVRQWIISRYPNNYVDSYQAAIDWGLTQPLSSQDYKDALNGGVPMSLLSDGVHPNAQGYAIMFTAPVTAFLIAKGYAIAA